MSEYHYTILLYPEAEGGFSVDAPELPGCHTQGETVEEALANAKEAIELCIEYLKAKNKPIPTGAAHSCLTQTT